MKLLGALLLLTPPEVECKDIKQKMMENRLKFDRDVVIHGDEEEDDWDPWDLEDDELQARLRKLVVRMDHNRDGYVDQEELTSWGLVSIYNIQGKDGREDYEFLLHDGASGLDFVHLTDDIYGHIFYGDEAEPFDKDDSIYDEYNKIDQKAVLAEALNSVDTDGDGKISLQEYLKDWHQTPSNVDEEFMELETDRFKDEYDRDSNGFIEADELIFWLSPDNTEIAIDEAEHLIDMCDEDEDERLTPDEIVDNHDLWVDSDATEYGAQLRHYDEL
ncbi:Oidioi.mRNA.OKI2018_I69.PAR.g11863.t2.cds [Oikopleura dioica]|uniref:Oidioi.mRNA.OKI2018_I69.PAR.g11863.t2.cds n=1 Tax=Oikopleura dioica TaxID=34765 RepID=A0ABN7RY35_OIKDI|nr:Oidioi.mRNA.OKI2018_I69.PAR.g11863.t2.cds [Oikopleura dioica]